LHQIQNILKLQELKTLSPLGDLNQLMRFRAIMLILVADLSGLTNLKAQDGSDILYLKPNQLDTSFVGDYVHLDFFNRSFHGKPLDTVRLFFNNAPIRFVEHRVDDGFNNWFNEQYLQSIDRQDGLILRITKSRIESVTSELIWVTHFISSFDPNKKEPAPLATYTIEVAYSKRMIAEVLVSADSHDKIQRVIILSDIEADPDDTQSFIRLFLYSNVIDLKGLIATTSVHQKNNVYPGSIRRIINAYGKVQPNLQKHEAGYPPADNLLKLVKQGLPEYGMKGVGNGKDSEGSDWIIKTLEENDSRPLWIPVWGGANTLAQALFKLKNTKSAEQLNRLIGKF